MYHYSFLAYIDPLQVEAVFGDIEGSAPNVILRKPSVM